MCGNEATVASQAHFHYKNLQNYECVGSRIILTKPLVDFPVLLQLDFSWILPVWHKRLWVSNFRCLPLPLHHQSRHYPKKKVVSEQDLARACAGRSIASDLPQPDACMSCEIYVWRSRKNMHLKSSLWATTWAVDSRTDIRVLILCLSLKSKSVHACRNSVTAAEPWVRFMGEWKAR